MVHQVLFLTHMSDTPAEAESLPACGSSLLPVEPDAAYQAY